jgi:PAS domain S-box-containing protein
MTGKEPSPLLRCTVAVGVVAIATVLTLLLWRWIDPLAFLVYFLAVMAAGWYGGLGPGLLATVLSVLTAHYFILHPQYAWAISPGALTRMGLFALAGTLISILNEAQRRARLSEQAQRERLAVTLTSIGDAVITTDAEGRVTFLNRVAETLTGWRDDEARSLPLPDVFPIVNEYTRQPVANPVSKVLESGAIVGLANHTILLARNGREVPIDDSAAPICDQDGEIRGVVLIFRDIAARRQAELNRQRLAAIVQSSEDAIISQDLEGRITSWNPAAERLYGYRAEEIVGSPVSVLLPPENDEELPQILERIKRGEQIEHYETIRRHKDGRLLAVSLSISPIHNADGEVVGASKIARDIHARRQAEAALQESRERLSLAMAAGQMGTWTRELDGTDRVDWSPELEAIFGLAAGEFPGTYEAYTQFIHPEDREKVGRAVREAVEQHTDYEVEFRFTPQGGGLRWMIGRGRATYDAAGRPVRLAGVGIDVTARRQAEEALRFLADASRELSVLVDYESTLQNVAHAAIPRFADWCVVHRVTDEGQIRCVAVAHEDPQKERLLWELNERQPLDWSSPAVVVRVLREQQPILLEQVPESYFDRMREWGGEEYLQMLRGLNPQSFITVPLLAHDRALGTIILGTTESRRRYTAADVAVAEDLARRAATALENARLYREAREADRRKDEFLAMLAHELRNPMAPISNALQLMTLRSSDPGVVARARDILQRQVEQLSRLVDDLLDVSRITRGKISLQKQRLDLGAVIARAVETSQPLIDSRRHRITLSLPPEPVELEADPARLEQILTNLLTNAAKYMEEEGQIWLTAAVEEDQAVLRVKDDGLGIAPEMLPRLFDLFAQAERSLDRSQGGLGIGLTLVRRLVEMHGGTVEARSQGLGKGSEFIVHLPLHSTEPREAAPRPLPPRPNCLPRSCRVLVVDDNVDSAESLAMLATGWGHAVEAGPAALEAARRQQPDLVLLDIGLPGMDGYEVARQLRRMGELKETLLIAMTGYGQAEDRLRSQAAGFQHHLVKPVDTEALRTLLGERS